MNPFSCKQCPLKKMVFFFLINFFLFTAHAQKPNIIYIMADDLGYADLSCYGRNNYKTPHLDKLASEGIKFTNAYAAAPVCTPTRVAFMTGLYPAKNLLGLIEPLTGLPKDSSMGLLYKNSIAARLREAGYETNLIGKWHLGIQSEYSPLENGFDYFFGFKSGAIDYISHRSRLGKPDLYENETPVQTEGYVTDILMTKAVEVISKPHQKPFFLSIMFNAPHWPWQAPNDKPYHDTLPWPSGGSAETYAEMMMSLDNAVGTIMKALDDYDLAKNTLVIFTSDNGGERFSDMGIYKGQKMQLWEGGIRVPAFVRWPDVIKQNSITAQVATTMDWTKTILSVAGAKEKEVAPLDGINLLPVFIGKQKESERDLFWRTHQRVQHKAMRSGKWKYFQDEKGDEYLFDLEKDPAEKDNLKEKEALIFTQLKNKYALWETTVLKPVPL